MNVIWTWVKLISFFVCLSNIFKNRNRMKKLFRIRKHLVIYLHYKHLRKMLINMSNKRSLLVITHIIIIMLHEKRNWISCHLLQLFFLLLFAIHFLFECNGGNISVLCCFSTLIFHEENFSNVFVCKQNVNNIFKFIFFCWNLAVCKPTKVDFVKGM